MSNTTTTPDMTWLREAVEAVGTPEDVYMNAIGSWLWRHQDLNLSPEDLDRALLCLARQSHPTA